MNYFDIIIFIKAKKSYDLEDFLKEKVIKDYFKYLMINK